MRVRLSVASDCSDATLSGTVRLRCAPGWSAGPDELSFELPGPRAPGGGHHAEVPADAEPGDYLVRATPRADRGHPGRVAAERRGRVRGLDRRGGVRAGAAGRRAHRHRRRPGETARLSVTVGTDARADLAVEAHLISPWGHLGVDGPAARGVVLRAGSTVDIDFDVAPPPRVVPGSGGRWSGPAARAGCCTPRGRGDGPMSPDAAVARRRNAGAGGRGRRPRRHCAAPQVSELPRPHTSEGRQPRRWLTQLLVTERVIARQRPPPSA